MRNQIIDYLLVLTIIWFSTGSICRADQVSWQQHIDAGLNAIKQNQDGEAEKEFSLAIAEAEKDGPNNEHLAHSLNNLGAVYLKEGKDKEAEPIINRAVELAKQVYGSDSATTVFFAKNLFPIYLGKHEIDKAEENARWRLEVNEKKLGPLSPEVADSLFALAQVLDTKQKYSEAEPLYRRALVIDSNVLGNSAPLVQDIRRRLDRVQSLLRPQTGKLESARASAFTAVQAGDYSTALPILKDIVDQAPHSAMANWDYGGTLFSSASRYYTKGKNPPFSDEAMPILKEAEVYLKKAAKQFGESSPTEKVLKSQAYYLLGDIYHYAFDSIDKAESAYNKAIQINPKNDSAQRELNKLAAKRIDDNK